jgi:DivIVA domain-containing protein
VLIVFVLIAVVVVFVVAALAVGRGGGLEPVTPDLVRPSLPEGPISADDLVAVRFAVVFRGYRMDQVDAVLDRLGHELAERDARVEALELRLSVTGDEDGQPG